jgi:hypothetical protein
MSAQTYFESVKGKPQHSRTAKQTRKATGKERSRTTQSAKKNRAGERRSIERDRKLDRDSKPVESRQYFARLCERDTPPAMKAVKIAKQMRWDFSPSWQSALDRISKHLQTGNARNASASIRSIERLVRKQQADADTFLLQLSRISKLIG